MERHRVPLLRLTVLLVCAVFGRTVPSPESGGASLPYPGGARAVDGDTILLASGERLRLLSVDCPETGRPGAEEARALSAAFLERAGPLTLESAAGEPARDRYGRILADLRAQGESLSEALISAGLGWVYRSQDAQLLAAQERAVSLRRGIHVLLDHPVCDGPFVLTSASFHRPGCSVLRQRAARLPWAAEAADALAAGKAPCRRCLAWPPAPPFGAPAISWQPEPAREWPPPGR